MFGGCRLSDLYAQFRRYRCTSHNSQHVFRLIWTLSGLLFLLLFLLSSLPPDHRKARRTLSLSRPSRASVKGARRARILAIRASSPGLPIDPPFHCCWPPVFRNAITPAINSRSLFLNGPIHRWIRRPVELLGRFLINPVHAAQSDPSRRV